MTLVSCQYYPYAIKLIVPLIIFFLRSLSITEINAEYLIHTNQCTIPDLPPYDLNVEPFPNNPSKPQCDDMYRSVQNSINSSLSYVTVENNTAVLRLREDIVLFYFNNDSVIYLDCCYKYIYRGGDINNPDIGVRTTPCIPFSNSVTLTHDTVSVSCYDHYSLLNTPIYEDVHQAVTRNYAVFEKAKNLNKSSQNKPISVLMIVIDSVSRLNFIRTMPKTRDFLLENNFYEFKGYNKVDDNTFPNAMALLSGLNLKDAQRICKPGQVDGLDNCPLIWYKYRDLGYATAYAEDWSSIATFNYFKKGFKMPPTDYYFKPYMDAVEKLPSLIIDTMPFCSGPLSQGDRILNLAEDFAKITRTYPSFGVFWMNTFSHNMIQTPSLMDETIKDFFIRLKKVNILDESVVILLSDHGIRFGDINNTTRGYYEVRLPMNYISLPNWFKDTYPDLEKHFRENTRKLTSTYDFYMTLQHFLHLSVSNYTVKPAMACSKCSSLLNGLPNERNCFDAGIPENWCTCNLEEAKIEEKLLKNYIEKLNREKARNTFQPETLKFN